MTLGRLLNGAHFWAGGNISKKYLQMLFLIFYDFPPPELYSVFTILFTDFTRFLRRQSQITKFFTGICRRRFNWLKACLSPVTHI